jgi:hypothetical protein
MAFTPKQLREYRHKLKAQGVCVRCHNAWAEDGMVVCAKCNEYSQDRKRKLVSNGMCRDCGHDTDSGVRCVFCADEQVQHRAMMRSL